MDWIVEFFKALMELFSGFFSGDIAICLLS